MRAPQFDVIVIGAGVIGLAIAQALTQVGRSVLIVERARQFGTETSARNSEVIHAGLYYPPDSMKARFCVSGKAMLYAFCEAHHVPFRRCGKIVVAANDDQVTKLEALHAQARQCGVGDLRLMGPQEIRRIESEIRCRAALLSPSTGIIDTHAYMLTLLGLAEAGGALLCCNTEVVRVDRVGAAWSITIAGEDAPSASAHAIVNAAGLGAGAVAARIEGLPERFVPKLRWAKGCYFGYSGSIPFNHLVYPAPEPGGLGIHLTLDLAGRARFGPDVEWVDQLDYAVDPARRDRFAQSIRRYWPRVNPAALHPDYAGMRPKLSGPGEPAADFMISGPDDHGVPGIVNLFGIESPGITASLAIAEHLSERLADAA